MKRNFYLQHPLMAMHDPRMQDLFDKEGPRGTGAYWIIIEKLSILPAPRAKLEYLRPYCKSKKMPLSYLKKIISEFQLFNLEEDGFFSPEELNPVKKKEKETAKNAGENAGSDAKNDENRQKTSELNPENQVKNQGNTLKDSTVEEIVCKVFKENIKDIITAAAKEKETTADADNDANNSPTTLTVCDDFGRPQAPLYPIRPWRELVDGLVEKTPWLEATCMHSGYGALLMRHIKVAVDCFKEHIEIYDKWHDLLTESDARRYFANYTNPGQRTAQALHATLLTLDAKQKSAAPPSVLTADAPIWAALFPIMPLPDRTPPLSGMNPHTHGARKCHTSWGQTPQLNKANATAEQSKCHRSRSSKCGICPHEVWHSRH